MKKIFYAAIFMMNIFVACNVMASDHDSVQITNNSSENVTLELYDAQGKTVRTGMGPIFLLPGQSTAIQKSYTVQRNVALDTSKNESYEELKARQAEMPFDTSVVASIHYILQTSGSNFTVPMPASSLVISSPPTSSLIMSRRGKHTAQ